MFNVLGDFRQGNFDGLYEVETARGAAAQADYGFPLRPIVGYRQYLPEIPESVRCPLNSLVRCLARPGIEHFNFRFLQSNTCA